MKPLKRRPAGRQRAAKPDPTAEKSTTAETPSQSETIAATSPVGRAAFTIDETVVMTGVGRDLIYEAIKDGRLVARKLGRRTIIPADALENFISHLPRVGVGSKEKAKSEDFKSLIEREAHSAADLLAALEAAKASGIDLATVNVHLGGGYLGSVDVTQRTHADGSKTTYMTLWITPC